MNEFDWSFWGAPESAKALLSDVFSARDSPNDTGQPWKTSTPGNASWGRWLSRSTFWIPQVRDFLYYLMNETCGHTTFCSFQQSFITGLSTHCDTVIYWIKKFHFVRHLFIDSTNIWVLAATSPTFFFLYNSLFISARGSKGDLQFPAMRRLSIATAHAFLMVYATTSLPSFECVKRCFEEVREQRPDFQVLVHVTAIVRVRNTSCYNLIDCSFETKQEVPIVIAGNKLDLATAKRQVPIEDVSEWLFCELPKLRGKVMECSAKDDYNIKELFRCFVTLSRIVPKNPTGEPDESGLRRRCSAYGSRR